MSNETRTETYAEAVVEADMNLYISKRLVTRLQEAGIEQDEIDKIKTETVRSQIALDGAIALLGTCEGAYPEGTLTEDGKVIRAYSLLAASRS